MKYTKFILLLFLILVSVLSANAQTKPKTTATPTAQTVKSSPAFAEILLRKTELTAELENYLADYTDEFPKVKELRFELDLLTKEMNRILAVNDAAKLTLALGKLMLRKIELERDVWNLRKQYNDEHPDVKQAKRKVEVFEAAIKEIL